MNTLLNFNFCASVHYSISQMKHQLDAILCRFYFCRVTLHVSGASAHHRVFITSTAATSTCVIVVSQSSHLLIRAGVPAIIRRCDNLPATITHVTVAAVLVLNAPDDGRLHPKHVE